MGTLRTGRNAFRDLAQHETLYQSDDPRDQALLARRLEPDRRTVGVMTGGSALETLGGIGGIVCGIIGLSGYRMVEMGALATLAIAVALLAQGGAIAARWQQTVQRLDHMQLDRAELVGGIGTEVFGGLVGIVLGALVLAGKLATVLLPVAAIVFGAAALLGGAAQPDIAEVVSDAVPGRRRYTHDAVQASGGVLVLTGIASAVLGILGLLGVGPVLTLSLVAMLCMGGALLAAGGALTVRLARHLR